MNFLAVTTNGNQNILISNVKISAIGEVVTKFSPNSEEIVFTVTTKGALDYLNE